MSNFEWQQVDALCKALLLAKICTKKSLSEQLTLTDFYGAWLTCKIQTQLLNTTFSNNLAQCLIIREQHIMNNIFLLYPIYLDPRFKNMLTLSSQRTYYNSTCFLLSFTKSPAM